MRALVLLVAVFSSSPAWAGVPGIRPEHLAGIETPRLDGARSLDGIAPMFTVTVEDLRVERVPAGDIRDFEAKLSEMQKIDMMMNGARGWTIYAAIDRRVSLARVAEIWRALRALSYTSVGVLELRKQRCSGSR